MTKNIKNDSKKISVLYISYDGILDSLGQSQVFRYLIKLALNYNITLISYEKKENWQDKERYDDLLAELNAKDIYWKPLTYHKRFSLLATVFDLFLGYIVSIYLILHRKIKLVHARSYIPSIIALWLKKSLRVPFIFDIRTFWADERVEAGQWRKGSWLNKIAKYFERQFIIHADIIVSQTKAGAEVIQNFSYVKDNPPKIEVIPTCVDLNIFYPKNQKKAYERTSSLNFTLGVIGNVAGWSLLEPIFKCFKILQCIYPNAKLLIINRGQHEYIRRCMEKLDVNDKDVTIKAIKNHTEIVNEINEIDAGIFFYKYGSSNPSRSPVKLAECLACGVPCLSNKKIGDVEEILDGEGVGVTVSNFSQAELENGIKRLLDLAFSPNIKERCVRVAHFHYSLEMGIQKYSKIYQLLSSKYE